MLTSKSALITGSLGGIGFATAKALAALGCDITLNGFAARDVIDARLNELREMGVRARYHPADLRIPVQIADMVASTQQEHGGLDILVNNAVVRYFGAIENFAPEHWNEALAVNLSAPFHTIRLALPGMKAKNWGRIVNMASIYGRFATVNRIDYITTKTALIGLTRGVALEVARTDITCNAICPGTVLTPAIDWRLRQEMQRDGTSFEEAEANFLGIRQPSRKFVKDENVAGLIAFLCGPHGDDINGADLPIDGAWTAGR
ncbi:MAG TPA: beta-D-hydroxybutyrate dehydrogenase [Acetobacteraceae bacterium]|jgi:3-hydroxybutyrate dehydrogenase|nr:beta-D-hydroxybutyrate dehydrogenase [Acetobacteraceae bacterium]